MRALLITVITMLPSLARAEPEAAAPGALVPLEAALPYGAAARHDAPGVVASVRGGYDASSDAVVLAGSVDATVIDRVALHVAIARDAASPLSHASGGVTIDVLRQSSTGVDLALGVDYDSRGWNRVPAAIARVAAARSLGGAVLVARAALGVGTEAGERFGEVEVGGLVALGEHAWVGLDAHGAIDLERDDDEPEAEPDWGVQAGPVASYALGAARLSAFAGVSSWRLRLVDHTYTGVIGSLGVSFGF